MSEYDSRSWPEDETDLTEQEMRQIKEHGEHVKVSVDPNVLVTCSFLAALQYLERHQ
jgi:hypothetical protein